MPDTGNVGNTEAKKEKEKEKEKDQSVDIDSSTILVINLDGDSNRPKENQPCDGPDGGDQAQVTPKQQQRGTDQGNPPANFVTKIVTFPFSSWKKKTPPVARKLFDPSALQSALNVLTTDSWLEDTMERKRRRTEESVPAKNLTA